jgi:hypothetical protein
LHEKNAAMKLIALDETKLESLLTVLEPVILHLQRKGNSDEADKVIVLKNYIRTRIETAPEVPTASSMGKKGGRSRSHKKLDAAKKNAEKAGPPGKYYARLVVDIGITDSVSEFGIHYSFPDKKIRDGWLAGPGTREQLLAVEHNLRVLQQTDPDAVAAGDPRLREKLERDQLFAQFERNHDDMEDCDGCGDLVERRDKQQISSNSLCHNCVSAIRPFHRS